jgi:hypothetical protein
VGRWYELEPREPTAHNQLSGTWLERCEVKKSVDWR